MGIMSQVGTVIFTNNKSNCFQSVFKLDQDKGEEEVWERSKNVCWIVHLYGFPPYTCGTYECLSLP